MGEDLCVRRLEESDVSDCAALATSVGWRSLEAQWRMMLGIGDGFGAFFGRTLVGTVIVNGFGDALASVAMMIVGAPYQRRGVGQRLMAAALDHAGDRAVFLYATELGRPLYERLGFVANGASRRMTARAATTELRAIDSVRPMRSRDLPGVRALDEEAHGAPRGTLIDALVAEVDRAAVVEDGGHVHAFGFSAVKEERRILGPIVARDDTAARAIAAHLSSESHVPVSLDLDPDDEAVFAWAAEAGFHVESASVRMVLHGARLPGQRRSVRCLAGRAFG